MSISSCQTGAICVSAPLRRDSFGLSFRQIAGYFRDMLLGLVLSLCVAVVVYAEEMPQGWVPEALALPEDAEVEMDRAIGSSIRMFSFTTGEEVEDLFQAWSSALEREGYAIRAQQGDLEGAAIEFSGRHILNGKIATDAVGADDRVLITFDATLE